jgi:hypothetical protein
VTVFAPSALRRLPRLAACTLCIVIAQFGAAIATPAQAANQPGSLLALFERIPDAPDSAAEAARWIDKDGRLIHPGLLALQADLRAQQQAIEAQMRQAAARDRAQGAVMIEDMHKGMADVGIDMGRMQKDPAYAKEVQERMRRMSPQEMVAMSQRMSQPLNQDPRFQNAARAKAEDAEPVRAAAEAGSAYQHSFAQRANTRDAAWRDAELEVRRILKEPLQVPASKPAMEWENIGCDASCRAQWDSYAAAALPLMIARDTAVLRQRRIALQRLREALAEGIRTADQHLQAAHWGKDAKSSENRLAIQAYNSTAVGEMTQLLDRIVSSARTAASTTHCGKQIVLVPRAVCR